MWLALTLILAEGLMLQWLVHVARSIRGASPRNGRPRSKQ